MHFPLIGDFAERALTKLHGRLDLPDLKPCYAAFPEMPLVSISDSQRRPMPAVNWVGTIPHGLSRDLLQLSARPKGDYLAFLGRISPEKRPDRAVAIAARAGLPFKIAAKVDKVDRDDWDNGRRTRRASSWWQLGRRRDAAILGAANQAGPLATARIHFLETPWSVNDDLRTHPQRAPGNEPSGHEGPSLARSHC